jgi:hypothetical protein
LIGRDPQLVLQVGSKAVEDGSHLPAFRFIVHAPSRFERVRAAWGLSLKNYTDSFELDTDLVNAIASHELLGEGMAEDSAAADIQRVVASRVEVRQSDSIASARTDSVLSNASEVAAEAATAAGGHRLSDVDIALGEGEGDGKGGAVSGYESDGKMGTSKLLPSTTSLRVISTTAASGKSSSWFFCSKDSRFLVKTCTASERDVLLKILSEYSKVGGDCTRLESTRPKACKRYGPELESAMFQRLSFI